jgi:hypothetical protein
MNMKIAVTLAFLINTFLGSFCMMDMAHAEMPTEHESMMEEMEMTPMVPIPQSDCPHCEHTESESQSEHPKSVPCDSGHCLSHTTQTTSEAITITSSSNTVIPVALTPITFSIPLEQSIRPFSTAPPNTVLLIQTVVLRF